MSASTQGGHSTMVRVGVSAGLIAATGFGLYMLCKRQRLRVHRLVIYPIKGCKGVNVKKAKIHTEGLEHDREYMVVSKDEAGVWSFRSQRDLPKMALIEPSLPVDGKLMVKAPGMDSLEIGLPKEGAEKISLKVWGDEAEGLDCGDAAAAWFAKYLEHPGARLLHHTGTRKIDPKFGEGSTRFSDGYPILVTTLASITDVETVAGVNLGCERMRPNLVLAGADKYAEDLWQGVSCGGIAGEGGGAVRMQFLKPCARCTVPRVDPATGTVSKDPLAAIKPYRSGKAVAETSATQKEFLAKSKGNVFFGQNAQPALTGFFGGVAVISVGDGAQWF